MSNIFQVLDKKGYSGQWLKSDTMPPGVTGMNQIKGKARIGRNVFLLGFTSLFTDISSEMIYPLIQAFLQASLGGARALLGPALGVIEGTAEATASLLKVYAGSASDRLGRRKPLVIGGYSLSALSKLIYLAAGAGWGLILLARFMDRTGKGFRTAPRDALIAESAGTDKKGRAYGFHRAMDYTGAVTGVLICYLVSARFMDPSAKTITDMNGFYALFLISLIPAAIGVFFLFLIRDRAAPAPAAERPRLTLKGMDGRMKLFLVAVCVFTLGNSSNQFLLLRSMDLGASLRETLLMYLAFNLSTALLSAPLGSLSDRIGRKKLIIAGYVLYAAIYSAFGFVSAGDKPLLWAFWIAYGIYYALTEGIEKALVADLAPACLRGTALGLFGTVTGLSLLPASLIAGVLYSFAGKAAPFVFSGGLACLSALMLMFLREHGNDAPRVAVPR